MDYWTKRPLVGKTSAPTLLFAEPSPHGEGKLFPAYQVFGIVDIINNTSLPPPEWGLWLKVRENGGQTGWVPIKENTPITFFVQ